MRYSAFDFDTGFISRKFRTCEIHSQVEGLHKLNPCHTVINLDSIEACTAAVLKYNALIKIRSEDPDYQEIDQNSLSFSKAEDDESPIMIIPLNPTKSGQDQQTLSISILINEIFTDKKGAEHEVEDYTHDHYRDYIHDYRHMEFDDLAITELNLNKRQVM